VEQNVSDDVPRIRSARQADLRRIAEIDHARFGELAWSLDMLHQLFWVSDPLWIVAVADGEVVGYALNARAGGDGSGGWIMALAVEAAWEGQGIGHDLLAETMERMRQVGITTVRLFVKDDNDRAWKLYKRSGFLDSAAEYADCLGPGKDRVMLTLFIDDDGLAEPTGAAAEPAAGPAAGRRVQPS
jgi:ribosomal protein S18 acetylase RimI-like enzyme